MLGNPEERCDDPAVPVMDHALAHDPRNPVRQAQESLFKRRAMRGVTATALTFVAYGGKGEHSIVVVVSRCPAVSCAVRFSRGAYNTMNAVTDKSFSDYLVADM